MDWYQTVVLRRTTLSNETVQKLIEFSPNLLSLMIKASEFNMYQKERWDGGTVLSLRLTVRHVFEVAFLIWPM